MRLGHVLSIASGVLLVTGSASCSGGTPDAAAPSSSASTPSTSLSSPSASTGSGAGGETVTEGPATFTLGTGVTFVDAVAETPAPATRVRRWTWAPAGGSTQCTVVVNVQGGFTGDFPQAQRVVFKARIEAQGGQVLVNDAGQGPPGTRAGLLQHSTTPNLGTNRDTTVSTWTRSYVTAGGTYVELAAASSAEHETTCQTEAIAASLGWTGAEAAGPAGGGA